MKKKVMSAVLAAAMVVGMAGNVVTVSAKEKYYLIQRQHYRPGF
mgnify:CR=1 FL=1